MTSRYEVVVSREDGVWVALVKGLRGGATESRRLDRLEAEVRDLVSGLTDVDPDDLDLEFRLSPALPAAALKALKTYQAASAKLQAAREEYDRAQVAAVSQLSDAQVSLRDSGHLVGLSFQRVQQIASHR